jgi:hypothetical protein
MCTTPVMLFRAFNNERFYYSELRNSLKKSEEIMRDKISPKVRMALKAELSLELQCFQRIPILLGSGKLGGRFIHG